MSPIKQINTSIFFLFLKNYKGPILLGLLVFLFNFLRINLNAEGVLNEPYKTISVDLCIYLLIIFSFVLITWIVGKVRFVGPAFRLVSSVVIILVLVEIGCMISSYSYLWKTDEVEHKTEMTGPVASFSYTNSPESFFSLNEEYGFSNRTSDTVISKIILNGERQPDVRYVFDEYGRRTREDYAVPAGNKYALFFGCSVTFGLHVDVSHTLPFLIETLNNDFVSYNYGISSSGPNHYLAMLQNMDLRSQIPEKEGVMIYPYFDHHVSRAICDYQTYDWNRETPYYYIEGNELIRKGSFKKGRPILSAFFSLIGRSYFAKAINFNYPKEVRDKDFKLTARIINEMKLEYKHRFNNDNFIVLILPGFGNKIIPYLNEYQLDYLDYSEIIPDFWGGEYTFPNDNHPNEKAYRILADSLSIYLNKKF